ncbi:WxL domain-containing protein [Loigolactobacillus binensis]|uniref:WxL domain-containing protein n=1 Tax=Loigolactobacillus binensis TaxID=2559922 RepID=A0ABW3EBC6_9LACO|nr:WxL domain-containing protein [Loigolactobacillus binensis]
MMKKSALLTVTAMSGLLLSGFATNVSAETVASTAKSDATATFTDAIDPTNPIDPTDPTDPENPGGGPGTGNSGPLSIDYVSNLEFGEHDVPTKDEVYTAQDDQDTDGNAIPNYVQVTDQRAGTPKGWTLSVMQEAQFASANDTALDGAQLSFSGTAITSNETTDSPASVHDVTLTPGNSTTIMDAATGNGFGTWADKWSDSNDKSTATLAVPVAAHPEAEDYKTNLTWTLTDTPANA